MVPFSIRAMVTGAFTIALGSPVSGVLGASSPVAGTDPGSAVHAPKPQTRADLAQSMRGEAFANAS